MSSTYSQIYIHIIFAVKGREALILPSWETQLYKYITGIVQNKEQKMLAINGVSDILIGMRPSCCLSDLIREVKKSSNEFIKKNSYSAFKFQWQEGFGAFSYSHSQLNNIIEYIKNQKDHHKGFSFKQEYLDFLKKFEVQHKKEYLFEFAEEG